MKDMLLKCNVKKKKNITLKLKNLRATKLDDFN
jgi:hypothetical protein